MLCFARIFRNLRFRLSSGSMSSGRTRATEMAFTVRRNAQEMRQDAASVNRFLTQIRKQDDEITLENKSRNPEKGMPPVRNSDVLAASQPRGKKTPGAIFDDSDSVRVSAPSRPSASGATDAGLRRFAQLKQQGNSLFRDHKPAEAVEKYTQCLQINPDAAVYSNRAACYDKIGRFEESEADCTSCLHMDPAFFKAYYRRGLARKALKKYREAISDFQKGIVLRPDVAVFRRQILETTELLRVQGGKSTIKRRFLIEEDEDDGETGEGPAAADPKEEGEGEGVAVPPKQPEQPEVVEKVAVSEASPASRETPLPQPQPAKEQQPSEPIAEPVDEPEEVEEVEDLVTPSAAKLQKELDREQRVLGKSKFFSPMPAAALERKKQRERALEQQRRREEAEKQAKAQKEADERRRAAEAQARAEQQRQELEKERQRVAAAEEAKSRQVGAEIDARRKRREAEAEAAEAASREAMAAVPVAVAKEAAKGQTAIIFPKKPPRSFSEFEVYLRQFADSPDDLRKYYELVMRRNRKSRGYFVRLMSSNLSSPLLETLLDAVVNRFLKLESAIGVQLAYDVLRLIRKLPRHEIMVQFSSDLTKKYIYLAFEQLAKKITADAAAKRLEKLRKAYLSMLQ